MQKKIFKSRKMGIDSINIKSVSRTDKKLDNSENDQQTAKAQREWQSKTPSLWRNTFKSNLLYLYICIIQ